MSLSVFNPYLYVPLAKAYISSLIRKGLQGSSADGGFVNGAERDVEPQEWDQSFVEPPSQGLLLLRCVFDVANTVQESGSDIEVLIAGHDVGFVIVACRRRRVTLVTLPDSGNIVNLRILHGVQT